MGTVAVVIGAGIVGLHVARVLNEAGHEVYVLDSAPYLAEHTSGRNSGVIHSGIFYTPGSFKEEVCIEGNRRTYEWVDRLKVPHEPCGKWVVPEEGQEEELEPFLEKISRLPIPPADLYLLDEPSAFLDVEQRLIVSKVIREVMQQRGATCLVVDHDLLFLDYLSDRMIVFDGTPAKHGEVHGPMSMEEGMNMFLEDIGLTFRRDMESYRPRANKVGSQMDREQKAEGKLYYI